VGGRGGSGGWVGRHKLLTAVLVVLVIGWAGSAGADKAEPARGGERSAAEPRPAPTRDDADDEGADAEPREEPAASDKPRAEPRDQGTRPRGHRAPRKTPSPTPKPVATTYLVTRVIDGDTLELASGQDVRLVGIDTPEVGECGYDAATANLARLVEGERVRLSRSDEDRDRYGRLLRYVDIGEVDAGLRLIKNGLAIARYDSRDGYGFHQREPVYVAADSAHRGLRCAAPAPRKPPAAAGGACAPGYTPCVPPFPPDVDCADVDGPVAVTGPDPHGLDADGDGVACE